MILARKITRAKWQKAVDLGEDEISADAITVDLRTKLNTLSFWRVDSSAANDLKNAVLALAAGADHAEKFDVAWLEDSAISSEDFSLASTLGDTPVESLRDKHVDICRLDLVRLGRLATLLQVAIRSDQWKRLTKKDVVELLGTAVKQGTLSINDLKPKVRHEIEHYLTKSAV